MLKNCLTVVAKTSSESDLIIEISKYDEKGNLIHFKNSNGFEYTQEYDENNNMIHFKDNEISEYWKEYDRNGKTFIL